MDKSEIDFCLEQYQKILDAQIINILITKIVNFRKYIACGIVMTSLLAACSPTNGLNQTTPTPTAITFKSGGLFCSAVTEDPVEGKRRRPVQSCDPEKDPTCVCE